MTEATQDRKGTRPTELDWLTVKEVAEFERISEKQVKRRTKIGAAHGLVSRLENRSCGGVILKIDPRSMTWDAQQRYKQAKLKEIAGATGTKDVVIPKVHNLKDEEQPDLFPRTELDEAIEQARCRLAPSQASVAVQRLKLFQPSINHDLVAQGWESKTKYMSAMAKQTGCSLRSVQRWRKEFKEVRKEAGLVEAIIALADERPGPERGTIALDLSMKTFIGDCWMFKKLTRKQTCRALRSYLETKQRGCGPRWAYEIPSDSTVCRFINAPEPYGLGGDSNPLRAGSEALKETCGYIDQVYDDEHAGDTWVIDEKEIDGAFYNPLRRREIFWSIYAVSVIDERTTKVLGIKLAYRLNADTVLDLLEEVLRNYWIPRRFISDRGGHFRGKVLRRTAVQSKSKLIDPAIGALDSLGVVAGGPRDTHNPRASRIERLHRIYSDLAQEQFGPSWRGRNVEERKMTGIDERVTRHIQEHCKAGTCGPLLLSTDDAERLVAGWVDRVNQADTDAKGCAGMTRQAAFEAFKPSAEEIERRRVSQAQIDEAFAERDARLVRTGGIIEAQDGLRYSSPEMIPLTGKKLSFSRLRRDHSRIYVEIDGRLIIAPHRVPTRRGNPEDAAREAEKLARINKLYSRLSGVPTLENAPQASDDAGMVHMQPDYPNPETAQKPRHLKSIPMTIQPVNPLESEAEPSGIGFADLE